MLEHNLCSIGVTVKVFVADMAKDMIVEPAVSVRAYLVQTVEEFKDLVAQVGSVLYSFSWTHGYDTSTVLLATGVSGSDSV